MRKLTLKHDGNCAFDATIEHNGECDPKDSYLAITLKDQGNFRAQIEYINSEERNQISEVRLEFRGAEEKSAMARIFKEFAKELEDNLFFFPI
jgi:hypothetical protein